MLLRSEKLGLCYLTLCRRFISSGSRESQAVKRLSDADDNDQYVETPQYPKIYDTSFASRKERARLAWQEEIKNLPTVEEKLIKINMPKYYGYKVVEMNESRLPYNCLPAIQHYTRTLLETLPAGGESNNNEQVVKLVESVRGHLVEALEVTHDFIRHKFSHDTGMDCVEQEQYLSQTIVEQINRVLINSLCADFPHINELEVDFQPRHEAFWAVGGIEAPRNVVKSKDGREWQKQMTKEPVDRFMQYRSRPMLALRHRQQLTPWKTETEYINLEQAKQVPNFHYDPRTLGYTTGYRHGTNIPGHWPGNTAGFGFLSYQIRPSQSRLQINDAEDHLEALQAHAVQSSFAWLLALANYNGFNTYCDLTYPMNTQTIITDGKYFSFYEYQLNTLLMNGRHISENPRVNYCRGTQDLHLYQEIDEQGKLVGFNDNVLYNLINYYTSVPNVQLTPSELTPYLNTEHKYVADYEDEEKRQFLEETFKHMCSNRPRHLPIPETYTWEKIYKIDNKTRPMEARRRFFEVFVNPWKRTLDQHDKKYIPKALRPEGPKSKNKWKRTYYP